jgi:ubiquinone/menaquinone biosynthesis C-methylase UbiE
VNTRGSGVLSRLAHAIAAQPAVYDTIQRLAGLDVIRQRLEPRLAETAGRTVLDVGAGTGLYLTCFPASAEYIWLDNDPQKLQGFRRWYPDKRRGFLGDAARLGLKDRSVDYATCTNVTHHLDDGQLARCVEELARVVRRKLIVQDAVMTERFSSRMLWSLDRGSYPRSGEALVAAFQDQFDIQDVERYAVLHEYVLLRAVPRR